MHQSVGMHLLQTHHTVVHLHCFEYRLEIYL